MPQHLCAQFVLFVASVSMAHSLRSRQPPSFSLMSRQKVLSPARAEARVIPSLSHTIRQALTPARQVMQSAWRSG